MKKQIIIVLVFLLIQTLSAQNRPLGFQLDGTAGVQAGSDVLPAGNTINAILVVGDTVWIGTSRGLSKTTDQGASWTNYYNTPAFGSESISAIAYDYATATVYASTAHSVNKTGQDLPEGSGLRYSKDNGATWQTIPQPIDKQSDSVIQYGVNSLRALPVTVAVQNIIYDIAIAPSGLYVATFAGGLRRTTDNGVTWERVVLPPDNSSSISPTDTLNFCLAPVGGKFCSSGNLNHRVFSVMAVSDTIWVGTANGINKSVDGGISWKKYNHQNQVLPISGNFVVSLGYSPAHGIIYAGTWKAEDQNEYYGLSYSTDWGKSWHTNLHGEKVHNITASPNKTVVVTDNGPLMSLDMGKSWLHPGTIRDAVSKLPLYADVFYSASFSVNGARLYLGSTQGLVSVGTFGTTFDNDWKLFFTSQPLKAKDESYAFPVPFSPKNEYVKIKYSTGGKSLPVTIRIYDFGMNYVRTIIQQTQRGSNTHQVAGDTQAGNAVIDFWDGKDDSGSIVPNGVYFYRIEAGDEEPMFGKIVVLQ